MDSACVNQWKPAADPEGCMKHTAAKKIMSRGMGDAANAAISRLRFIHLIIPRLCEGGKNFCAP